VSPRPRDYERAAFIGLILGTALALAVAFAPDALAAKPATPPTVVCDANVEPVEVVVPGQYGTVTGYDCHAGTFQGAPVRVLFVD
jgi:hypothetical protein